MTVTISTVTVDCADAATIARFWAAALGWDVAPDPTPEFAAVGGPHRPRDTPSLLFVRVPEGRAAKNRWHLDLSAEDPEAEIDRLVGLGATVLHRIAEQDAAWATLADPEANEFCVALPHQLPAP